MSSLHTSTVSHLNRQDDEQHGHLSTITQSSEAFVGTCRRISTLLSSPSIFAGHARRRQASDRLRSIGDKAWDTVFGVGDQSLQVALGSILRMARHHQAIDMSGTSLMIKDVARVRELQASTTHDLEDLCDKWRDVLSDWKADGGNGADGSGSSSTYNPRSPILSNNTDLTAALDAGYTSLSALRDTITAFWASIIPPTPQAIVNASQVEQITSRLLSAFGPAEQNYRQGVKRLASLPDVPEPPRHDAIQARITRALERVTHLFPSGVASLLKLFIGGGITLLLLFVIFPVLP